MSLPKEERRMWAIGKKRLRKIFGPKRHEVRGNWENSIMRSFVICTLHHMLILSSNQGE
jgi:hypothetical protein